MKLIDDDDTDANLPFMLDKIGEVNSTVVNRMARRRLKCSICPPNKGENEKRKAKHGAKKPRSKNKRGK